MSAKLRATAYHEAGHAVVDHCLEHTPERASILARHEEGSLGRVLHLDGDLASEAGRIDLAASALAGELAAVLANAEDASNAALGAAYDHDLAAEYLKPLPPRAMAQARAKAERILVERWATVEAVAEALIYLGEIEMEEISSLVEGEWTLRDCVVVRLKWGGIRGPVPADALERFGLTLDEKLLADWRARWEATR